MTVITIRKTKKISGLDRRLDTIKTEAEIQIKRIATEVQV